MLTLSMEASAREGSLAILNDGEVRGVESWSDEKVRSQQLFELLPKLYKKTSINPNDIDLYAIGRGPGSYTGLRVSLTAVRALALPGKKEVYAISSGEVLAAMTAAEMNASHVAVVGDARRERLWIAIFKYIQGLQVEKISDWMLINADELVTNLPETCVVVSSEWTRLKDVVEKTERTGMTWIKEDRFPRADILGQLVMEKRRQGVKSEPLNPIYMHPPVFVEPRFPVTEE